MSTDDPENLDFSKSEAWSRVFRLIDTDIDALAFLVLFERGSHQQPSLALTANGDRVHSITGDILLGERSMSAFVARYLNSGRGVPRAKAIDYRDLYEATRGDEPSEQEIANFVSRCAAAGVHFSYTPWPDGE